MSDPHPQKTPSQAYSTVVEALNRLIKVVAKLRSPDDGCPWDLAQTPQTLIPYIIEEAHEVVYAIRSKDNQAIVEELGDLLLQVILQAQIASDEGHFSLKEVAQGITNKLIRRHPHIFGDIEVKDKEEVSQNWEKIKAQEKGETPEIAQLLSRKLNRYNQTLSPLMASNKILVKAASAGFEWETVDGILRKFTEELGGFKQVLEVEDKAHQEAKLGDLLFILVDIARLYGLSPSEALQGTNEKFIQRLSIIETFADRSLTDYTVNELKILWQKQKNT
ncbi:MAG: nucleoside triphosphate pyrophosphohydrolase [cyanobacterium endosymbiont of Rhopalodia musculus]|uniref:nucleoside triphosphate pyrophosphohydrolase n=1 Tax=cyanobacterium endosymbiont of Epithemia clementina EcSB TaxID=3034674 RepID=UPI0024800A38|nr:nucleoside triphosphate pyrophosphohydrolase [cyanobacterium endosymbiont of Epithemia clementina EcSB]WGT68064.1 nucleoside triphosphate pyrophosphohydrolase [cyanobacterium endosymbiont of Epithemia clementina EcSB]